MDQQNDYKQIQIKKGDKIGWIGNSNENGNWVPHLHFQILLSLLNYKNDFPGVIYHDEKNTWKFLCPDPNFLIKSKNLDSTDGLAVAMCHFYNSKKIIALFIFLPN